jgi:nucleotide sugar dehydrogenase
MLLSPKKIESAIQNADLTISVLGLGWMGLPTACLFSEVGAQVIGVDVDFRIVELLNAGHCHINEPGLQSILKKHIGQRLTFTTDVRWAAAQSDIIIIVVPTGVDDLSRPNYAAVEKACKEIGLTMKHGCMVILESTVGPGVTEIMVKNVLETRSGYKAGDDFGLAYSPIRAMAGRVLRDIQTYPKIVGGIDERSADVATTILSSITTGSIIRVSDMKTAEVVKLFENVYRDVNIALASELAVFCEKAGLDFLEIKKAATTQPYCHLHVPRIGVGGHCIPYNPYFLVAKAESIGVNLTLVKNARKINDWTPYRVVELIIKGLKDCNKRLKNSKIAVLGVSYRDNVKDTRNSPSLIIIETLTKKGAKVRVYDPFFSAEEIKQLGFYGTESVERAIIDVDCILIAVGHEQFKQFQIEALARLLKKPACIVDGWRIFKAEDAKINDLQYYGIGLG